MWHQCEEGRYYDPSSTIYEQGSIPTTATEDSSSDSTDSSSVPALPPVSIHVFQVTVTLSLLSFSWTLLTLDALDLPSKARKVLVSCCLAFPVYLLFVVFGRDFLKIGAENDEIRQRIVEAGLLLQPHSSFEIGPSDSVEEGSEEIGSQVLYYCSSTSRNIIKFFESNFKFSEHHIKFPGPSTPHGSSSFGGRPIRVVRQRLPSWPQIFGLVLHHDLCGASLLVPGLEKSDLRIHQRQIPRHFFHSGGKFAGRFNRRNASGTSIETERFGRFGRITSTQPICCLHFPRVCRQKNQQCTGVCRQQNQQCTALGGKSARKSAGEEK